MIVLRFRACALERTKSSALLLSTYICLSMIFTTAVDKKTTPIAEARKLGAKGYKLIESAVPL